MSNVFNQLLNVKGVVAARIDTQLHHSRPR